MLKITSPIVIGQAEYSRSHIIAIKLDPDITDRIEHAIALISKSLAIYISF